MNYTDLIVSYSLISQKLYSDKDLHDELKKKLVQMAVNHWTGKNRLSAEDANKLLSHRDVVYVFQRLQMLQYACHTAGIQVPLDHMLERKNKLDLNIVLNIFGQDMLSSQEFQDIYRDEVKGILQSQRKAEKKDEKTMKSQTVKQDNISEPKITSESIDETTEYKNEDSNGKNRFLNNLLIQAVSVVIVASLVYALGAAEAWF